jgi:alginate O-acetyltransferase complex protein AlgI
LTDRPGGKRVLFNSYEFIFLFLPVVAVGFFLLSRIEVHWAAAWLVGASFFFYSWWNPKYVVLLAISTAFNYSIGTAIAMRISDHRTAEAKKLLIRGIAINLGLLGFFKYTGFFVENIAQIFNLNKSFALTLPLGISFFTFTQIAYLVDAFYGRVTQYDKVHYSLFVSYFPHLIAGPILHHDEMIKQFERRETYRFSYDNVAAGLTIFFIGLFKKVVLADSIAAHADPVFDAAAINLHLSFVDAWSGAICYGLQLYFDFSGYSDMAIGLSRLFGISLPVNFFSPYKAVNIIEFWKRWHMTLSRFLREYLYIPLGGNRNGQARRYVNLMITMLLGGLWHGAGWTFVVWGGLHGTYLIINHGWQALRLKIGHDLDRRQSPTLRAASILLTFLAVTFAWSFFRAKNLSAGLTMAGGMLGKYGSGLSTDLLREFGSVGEWLSKHGLAASDATDNYLVDGATFSWIAALLLLAWFAPNTQQIMSRYEGAMNAPIRSGRSSSLTWRPSIATAALVCIIAMIALGNLSKRSAFLYFQF